MDESRKMMETRLHQAHHFNFPLNALISSTSMIEIKDTSSSHLFLFASQFCVQLYPQKLTGISVDSRLDRPGKYRVFAVFYCTLEAPAFSSIQHIRLTFSSIILIVT